MVCRVGKKHNPNVQIASLPVERHVTFPIGKRSDQPEAKH